jgi:hypothetical protein
MFLSTFFADSQDSKSLGSPFRKKRFSFFLEQTSKLNMPLQILDVGGTESYWKNMGLSNNPDYQITLLNLEKEGTSYENISSISGNATDLSLFSENHFDIAFSNSAIEHLYHFENQQLMAKEVQRVGKYHFIQTPNKYFFIEPHFIVPFFQFLPYSLQIFILTKTRISRMRCWRKERAESYVQEIKLLSLKEMKTLFPNSNFDVEKFLGMNKSFTAHNF